MPYPLVAEPRKAATDPRSHRSPSLECPMNRGAVRSELAAQELTEEYAYMAALWPLLHGMTILWAPGLSVGRK